MTTATADPLTREALDQLLARLTDDEKKYVLGQLLPPILAAATAGPVHGVYSIRDASGKWVGDLVPAPRPRPGDPVGMTDADRAYLAAIPRKTLAEWRAEEAMAKGTQPAGANG